ncbi:MAG: hypothetical protein IJ390_03720 [Lachnospiraceae bacterium]|nr:hypothetical protein [Lachnospiraceae bacterium]
MNCLWVLILLFCCGNQNRGWSGCGSSCWREDDSGCGCMRNDSREGRNREERRDSDCGCEREVRRERREERREREMDEGCGCERETRRERREERREMDGDCGCDDRRNQRSTSRYDSSMRSQENPDVVPGMGRSVTNGYASYQNS